MCNLVPNGKASFLGFVLTLLFVLPTQGATRTIVMSPTEKVAGQSQADYTVRWWQWANRVPDGDRPYQDPSGSQCALNQSGDVWFLAGTDGTDDAHRQCTMPAGKYIFLPVINMLVNSAPGQPITCDEAKASAAANNEHLAEAEVLIDGQAVRNIELHRVRSADCFDAFPDATYLCECKCKQCTPRSYFPAASDGYWLMLRPLAPGQHQIKVKARYDNPGSDFGDLEQVFEYQLLIQGKDQKTPPAKPVQTPDSIFAIVD
jgi:hypothetical protein